MNGGTRRLALAGVLLASLVAGGAVSVLAGEESTGSEPEAEKDQLCSEAIDMDRLLKSDQYQELSASEKDDFFLRAWEITVRLKDLGYPSDVCDREATSGAQPSG